MSLSIVNLVKPMVSIGESNLNWGLSQFTLTPVFGRSSYISALAEDAGNPLQTLPRFSPIIPIGLFAGAGGVIGNIWSSSRGETFMKGRASAIALGVILGAAVGSLLFAAVRF